MNVEFRFAGSSGGDVTDVAFHRVHFAGQAPELAFADIELNRRVDSAATGFIEEVVGLVDKFQRLTHRFGFKDCSHRCQPVRKTASSNERNNRAHIGTDTLAFADGKDTEFTENGHCCFAGCLVGISQVMPFGNTGLMGNYTLRAACRRILSGVALCRIPCLASPFDCDAMGSQGTKSPEFCSDTAALTLGTGTTHSSAECRSKCGASKLRSVGKSLLCEGMGNLYKRIDKAKAGASEMFAEWFPMKNVPVVVRLSALLIVGTFSAANWVLAADQEGEAEGKESLVHCLLPSMVRSYGDDTTMLAPRRVVQLTAAKCQDQGGEVVTVEPVQ